MIRKHLLSVLKGGPKMAVDALAHKLGLLLAEGSLASSRLTERDRTRLRSLFETGVLEVARSGSGKRVIVKNRDAFDTFILRNYPSGLAGLEEPSTPRSKAVAELRDSKKARETGPLIVLLRGFDGCALRSGTEVLPIAELTELAGVAALHLGGRVVGVYRGLGAGGKSRGFLPFRKTRDRRSTGTLCARTLERQDSHLAWFAGDGTGPHHSLRGL